MVVAWRSLLLLAVALTPRGEARMMSSANPIRKVVTMLQNMQKKVIQEGEKEKALYDKFVCYCKTSGAELEDSIAKAEDKLDTLPSEIEETKDKLKSSKETLKKSEVDRAAAKQTMEQATSIREKENKAFMTAQAEYGANIKAIKKSVGALEAGTKGGSFLQTPMAQQLQKIMHSDLDSWSSMDDADRAIVDNFLQGKTTAPSSSIIGVLKQMGDEMQKALAEATKQEQEAQKDFDGMIAAKTKEVAVLTKSIEKKIKEIGDLGVEVVQMEADLDDTTKGLAEDKKFAVDLSKGCGAKADEWEKVCKARQTELVALGDTIKILNDDDALEMFKKTLPGSASSFLQIQVTTGEMKARALKIVRDAARQQKRGRRGVELDLLAMAMNGKKVDFSKVMGMIDDMVALLKKEQAGDDEKKAYCEAEFDSADDKKKVLEKEEKDTKAAIATNVKGIDVVSEEIEALAKSIQTTDAEVSEATAQRKAENSDFKDMTAQDTAAKEILKFAKNRLNKFYNPKLYKPPAKEEKSAGDRIASNFALTQASYKKETEGGAAVIAMIDLLIADLEKEMAAAEAEEKDAQGDYEQFVADSAAKRSEEKKALMDKESVKADMEAELEKQKGIEKDIVKELYGTLQYIDSLHRECDFLIDFYTVRKNARDTEIKAMTDAKAVLAGADYSFLEISSVRRHVFLGRSTQ